MNTKVRIFENENGIMLYQKEEIERGNSCGRYLGSPECTSCYSEGCYSLSNSSSGFRENMLEGLINKFKVKVNPDYNLTWAEDKEDFKEFLAENDILTEEISYWVDKYILENEEHTEAEFVYTGDGDCVKFLDTEEEITNTEHGQEIAKEFFKKEYSSEFQGLFYYHAPNYTFVSSVLQGYCAGYRVYPNSKSGEGK